LSSTGSPQFVAVEVVGVGVDDGGVDAGVVEVPVVSGGEVVTIVAPVVGVPTTVDGTTDD
jgi:hypothetical protein